MTDNDDIIPMRLPAFVDERIVDLMFRAIANVENAEEREHLSDLFVGCSRWHLDPDDATVHVLHICEDGDDFEISSFPGHLVGAVAGPDGVRFER